MPGHIDSPHHKPIDRWIPWMFVAFFAVVFAVNAVFVTTALRTMPGVVTEHAYEQGLAYNKTLAAEKKQEKLGWHGKATLEGGVLAFTLSDKAGKPISGASVRAEITRPVAAGHDQKAVLQEATGGLYQAKIELPLRGLWNVRIFSEWQGRKFQTDQDIEVK